MRREYIRNLTVPVMGALDTDTLFLLRRGLNFMTRIARGRADATARDQVLTLLEAVEDEIAGRTTEVLPASEDNDQAEQPEKVAGLTTNGTGV